jgi:hypothetical protein
VLGADTIGEMRFAVALLLLAGCDQTWNLDHLDHVDARKAFDVETDCPMGYNLFLNAGSRYNIVSNVASAWAAQARCAADSEGFTHLATATTRTELDALMSSLLSKQAGRWWLGAVQPTTATLPDADWLWMTGEPIDPEFWNSPDEPNDGNRVEDDHEDQFAFIDQGVMDLIDAQGMLEYGYLCECDGRAITSEAQIALDQSKR